MALRNLDKDLLSQYYGTNWILEQLRDSQMNNKQGSLQPHIKVKF